MSNCCVTEVKTYFKQKVNLLILGLFTQLLGKISVLDMLGSDDDGNLCKVRETGEFVYSPIWSLLSIKYVTDVLVYLLVCSFM